MFYSHYNTVIAINFSADVNVSKLGSMSKTAAPQPLVVQALPKFCRQLPAFMFWVIHIYRLGNADTIGTVIGV